MRTINSWNDLEAFGIVALTGEACGYAMRLLCDVTEGGKLLVERFLGGNVTIRPGSNWNGGSKDDPHVGSVLLSRGVFTDLAAFCLLRNGGRGSVAAREDGTVLEWDERELHGFQDGTLDEDKRSEIRETYERAYGIKRYYRRSTDPGTGDRNQHMMSGRTE